MHHSASSLCGRHSKALSLFFFSLFFFFWVCWLSFLHRSSERWWPARRACRRVRRPSWGRPGLTAPWVRAPGDCPPITTTISTGRQGTPLTWTTSTRAQAGPPQGRHGNAGVTTEPREKLPTRRATALTPPTRSTTCPTKAKAPIRKSKTPALAIFKGFYLKVHVLFDASDKNISRLETPNVILNT